MSDQHRAGQSGRRLTVQRLLCDAQRELDEKALAAAIGVPVARLADWSREDSTLTLTQKTAVVFAVITLAPDGSELFRSAASLRGRLAAELAYSLGATETKSAPPTRWFGS